MADALLQDTDMYAQISADDVIRLLREGASKLGASAGFIGKVGADAYGKDLRAVLERSGVDASGL